MPWLSPLDVLLCHSEEFGTPSEVGGLCFASMWFICVSCHVFAELFGSPQNYKELYNLEAYAGKEHHWEDIWSG